MIREAKSQYYQEKLTAADQSAAFKTIKSLLQPTARNQLPTSSSHLQLAEDFASFFSQKVEDIRASLASLETELTPLPPDISTTVSLCSFSPVTVDDVRKVIKRSPTKSCSLDVLPTWFLKDSLILEALLPHITACINTSLSSGCVPDCYKVAIVTPLLKKDDLDVNTYKNYRPVSNLPFLSKVLERVVADQLTKHMSDNNMYDPLQSAYRAAHSTESALIKVKGDIDTALGEGDGVLLLLLDLSAAFDTVDHTLLLNRIEALLGIKGNVKRWITSYLSSRSQSVAIHGAKSQPKPLSTGVPQGSVLGPLLFLAYVLPLGSLIDAHGSYRHGYADDSQLYQRFSLKHVSLLFEARDILEVLAEKARSWMIQNKLKVNDSKTEFMIIAPRHFHAKLRGLDISIRVGQAEITPSTAVRDLGAILDQFMDMQQQVSHVVRGMYANIRRISKIRHLLDPGTRATVIGSLVTSRLDFHNALLANLPMSTLRPLQLAQNVAARLVSGTRKSEHISPVLDSLHWLPVHKRVMFKILVFVYRALHGCAPIYLSRMLNIYRPSRTLRSMDQRLLLVIPRCTRSMGERSFAYAGPNMWNSLPEHLRASATIETFKKHLKTYLFTL